MENYIVNLENKYKAMYYDYVKYCEYHDTTFDEDCLNTAKDKLFELTQFEDFCKVFFNINITNCIPQC